MVGISFDVAHMLAGSLVLVSFTLLYQDRMYALLNLFALHAVVLSLSVAWQAFIQGAPHLYVTAAIAAGPAAPPPAGGEGPGGPGPPARGQSRWRGIRRR